MNFCFIYVHFNGQTISGVFEQFSFTSMFLGLEMQKSTFFKKKWFWEYLFYKIDVYGVTNWSVWLEKHKTLEILLMVDFYAFLKMLHFKFFWNSPVAPGKIVKCT